LKNSLEKLEHAGDGEEAIQVYLEVKPDIVSLVIG